LQRLKEWQKRRAQRMMAAAALRAGMVREILIVAVIALAVLCVFLSWGGVSVLWIRFIAVQSGGWLFIAALSYRQATLRSSMKASLFARTALFIAIAEMATLPCVRYSYPQFGGLVVLTIILAGLLISRWYVLIWTLAACVLQISQMAYL